MRDGSTAGFKYFEVKHAAKIGLTVRGDAGCVEIRLSQEENPAAVLPVEASDTWHTVWTELNVTEAVCPLYITYRGSGMADFRKLHFA